jgi:hypothetical protein
MHSTINTPFNFPSHAIKDEAKKKVVFCIPTIHKPYQQMLDSLRASIPLITAAGWEEGAVYQVGCPYISAARAQMLRKALDAKATVIVFIDHDLQWEPGALLRLIETEGDVVAGTYRFKGDPEEYMGALMSGPDECPIERGDGCLKAHSVPAGFLKVTRAGVNRFMTMFPELLYGERASPAVDLFNHGAHQWTWWGEDYAFSRRWREKCGDVWLIPDLNLTHWNGDTPYPGNFWEWLIRQDGGSESANPDPVKLAALQARMAAQQPAPAGVPLEA